MKTMIFGILLATSAFATEFFTFNMGEFEVTTPDKATYELIKKNKDCSRSIVKKYMSAVVWDQNMEDGVDLSEGLDLEMLAINKVGTKLSFELFLSADESVKGTAVRSRSGCLVELKK